MGLYYDNKKAATAIKLIADQFTAMRNGVDISVDGPPLQIRIVWREDKTQICGFTLVQQVNCCGALVSTRTFVNEKYRGQKLAQQMMPLKEAIAREFGYSVLAATVNISGNPAEVHILQKEGWQKGYEFLNKRTGNQVGFFFKELK